MTDKNVGTVCPSCDTENLPGTLFCVQCGTYLPSGGPLRTEPFSGSEGSRARPWKYEEGNAEDKMLSVALEVVNTGREMSLPLDAEILIGRLDAAHGIFPEVDLSADGGLEHGISRRHARIYMHESHCFIEDLDSTNGTFLNDERLTPYLPYGFNDGDALSLGTLQLKIRIHSTE